MSNKRTFRYAPSLTGNLHLGNLKILLCNILLASLLDGKVILRYDDTDIIKNSINSFNNLCTTFSALCIGFSEITFQSSHIIKIYHYADILKQKKLTYYCRCQDYQTCKCILEDYVSGVLMLNTDKIVKDSKITIYDTIHGHITFKKQDMYNIAIIRTNGMPLYNFSTVISDIIDNVTDIVRGNDHIINTWKQVVIYLALNIELPKYTHISLLLDEDKAKISKSAKNSRSIIDLLKLGYTADSIKAYLYSLITGKDDFYVDNKNITVELLIKKNKVNQCVNYKKLRFINKTNIKQQYSIINELQIYCWINNIPTPNYTDIIDMLNNIKFRHSTIQTLYQECKIFDEQFNLQFTLQDIQNLHLNDEEIMILQQAKKTNTIHNLQLIMHCKIRYILTGCKNGLEILTIIKYLDKLIIMNRITYSLSFIIF